MRQETRRPKKYLAVAKADTEYPCEHVGTRGTYANLPRYQAP